MSTTSWPASTVWAPLTSWAFDPVAAVDRGVAEPAQPAHRRVGDRGEPQQLADAARQPQVPHHGRAPRPRTCRPPRTRAVRPLLDDERESEAVQRTRRRSQEVVVRDGQPQDPRGGDPEGVGHPAEEPCAPVVVRVARAPGGPAGRERARPFRAGSAAKSAAARGPPDADPPVRAPETDADADSDEAGSADVHPIRRLGGEGRGNLAATVGERGAARATGRGGEQVVGPAERFELQPVGREGVVDPAFVHLRPPRRVGADETVQVSLAVRSRVDPRSGQRTRAEQDVAPAQPAPAPGPAPSRRHVPPSSGGQEAVVAAGDERGAVREGDPVRGFARRPVCEDLRGHVPAGSLGVHRGAHARRRRAAGRRSGGCGRRPAARVSPRRGSRRRRARNPDRGSRSSGRAPASRPGRGSAPTSPRPRGTSFRRTPARVRCAGGRADPEGPARRRRRRPGLAARSIA